MNVLGKKANWERFRAKPHIRTDPLFVLTFLTISRGNKSSLRNGSFIYCGKSWNHYKTQGLKVAFALGFIVCQNCTKVKLNDNTKLNLLYPITSPLNHHISEWDRRETPASRLFHKWFNKPWEWSEHFKCWTALDVQGFALSIINKESLLQYPLRADNWPKTPLTFILSFSLCLYVVNLTYIQSEKPRCQPVYESTMNNCNSNKESWMLIAIGCYWITWKDMPENIHLQGSQGSFPLFSITDKT